MNYQSIIKISTLGAMLALCTTASAGPPQKANSPIVLADQGSFLVGGTVVTNPGVFDPVNPTSAGQTIHGDASLCAVSDTAKCSKFAVSDVARRRTVFKDVGDDA